MTDTNKPLSLKLKAVIGYWIDYFSSKYGDTVTFDLFGEKVVIKDRDETYYTIYYKCLKLDVHYMNIFEALNLLERMLKNLED